MTVFGLTLEQIVLLVSAITGTSIIAAFVTLYNATAVKRFTNAQAKNSEAGALKQYIDALEKIGEEVNKLRAELARLRIEIYKRDEMIEHLNELLTQKNITIQDLRLWGESLVTLLSTHAPAVSIPVFDPREIRKVENPENYPLSADAAIPSDTVPLQKPVTFFDRLKAIWKVLNG